MACTTIEYVSNNALAPYWHLAVCQKGHHFVNIVLDVCNLVNKQVHFFTYSPFTSRFEVFVTVIGKRLPLSHTDDAITNVILVLEYFSHLKHFQKSKPVSEEGWT